MPKAVIATIGTSRSVKFLLARGADQNIKDTKVGSTAAGWADHGGHKELSDLLGNLMS